MANLFNPQHHLHTDTVNITRVVYPGVLAKYCPMIYTDIDFEGYQTVFDVVGVSHRMIDIFLEVCEYSGTFEQQISRAYLLFNRDVYKDGTPLLSYEMFQDMIYLMSITYCACQIMLYTNQDPSYHTYTFWNVFNTVAEYVEKRDQETHEQVMEFLK